MPADGALPGTFTSRLGFALYRELMATPGNLSFSPLGTANALVMAQAGASGATRREIEEALHCKGAGDALVAQISGLARWLPGQSSEDEAVRLSLATALWVQTGYPLHPAYVASLSERLSAEVNAVDFGGRPSEVVRTINAWVGGRTGNRIRSILSERDLTPLTRSILTNAIYLKAPWARPFDEELTHPLPFGTQIEVPTMFQTVHHDYAEDDGLQFVQVPYRNSRVSMLILLPERGQLERVERELDSARLTRLAQAMEPRDVWLFLPRFRVDSCFQLCSALKSLRMRTAFGPDADFTRASSEPGFHLGEIVQKAFVSVDESGTEAAAATASMTLGAILERVVVRVDRPFLFLIRDANTDTVLFMGRVADPRPA